VTAEAVDPADVEHLPLVSHTTVLGVDIVVNQRAERAAGVGKTTPGGLEPSPEFRTMADDHCPYRVQRELAAWARRNLFGGQP